MANEKQHVLCKHSGVFMSGMITAVISIIVSISICTHIVHHDDCFNITRFEPKSEVMYTLFKCNGHKLGKYRTTTENLMDNAIFLNYQYQDFTDFSLVLRIWFYSNGTVAVTAILLMFSSYIKANCCVGSYFVMPWMCAILVTIGIDVAMFHLWYTRYKNHSSKLYFQQLFGKKDTTTINKLRQKHGIQFESITNVKIGILFFRLCFDILYVCFFLGVTLFLMKHFCLTPHHNRIRPKIIRGKPDYLPKAPGKSIMRETDIKFKGKYEYTQK